MRASLLSATCWLNASSVRFSGARGRQVGHPALSRADSCRTFCGVPPLIGRPRRAAGVSKDNAVPSVSTDGHVAVDALVR